MNTHEKYNFLLNPPKEYYTVRIDSKEIDNKNQLDILSWDICFYDKDLKKNKYVMQYHPSLLVLLENFKVVLLSIGYENLDNFFRTQDELNHIHNKRIEYLNKEQECNFKYKTLVKKEVKQP